MKIKIEWADLRNMGATAAQLETYSNTDPLAIYQVGENLYRVDGAVEGEYDAQGVLDLLDSLGGED